MGGKILSFVSYCGGLPAPEASDNPLGYKFSWSPRGVLLALQNSAKYYKDGKMQEVPGQKLMASAQPYIIYPGFAFVAYPNRDSTPYKERYNIPEAHTIIRGSLRYQGFPEFVQVLVDSGFLNQDEHKLLVSSDRAVGWKEVLQSLLGTRTSDEEYVSRARLALQFSRVLSPQFSFHDLLYSSSLLSHTTDTAAHKHQGPGLCHNCQIALPRCGRKGPDSGWIPLAWVVLR